MKADIHCKGPFGLILAAQPYNKLESWVYIIYSTVYTVHKEERVRLVLLMQRENILFMTDTKGIDSYLADFCVLYKFASLEYVECTGI
jgi:hypothetical protein